MVGERRVAISLKKAEEEHTRNWEQAVQGPRGRNVPECQGTARKPGWLKHGA